MDLFDTYTKIVGYSADEREFRSQAQFIHDELKTYHQLFDIYHDYEGVANLKRVNDSAGAEPVKVDKKLMDFLEFAVSIHGVTDGKVNVAFGSVLSIWHDYREAGMEDPQSAELPPMEDLKAAAVHTDISNLILDRERSTVFLADPEMRLDVGALAKGFAAEAVCREARIQGMGPMLISVGGNVCALGYKDGKSEKWKVGVQNPDGSIMGEADILGTVSLADASLVTSGDYQRYYTVNGKTYNHIIDPATLMPAEHFRAVTIRCDDSAVADALSTAVFIMDFESGKKLVESVPGAGAVYVMKDGTLRYTGGFEKLTEPAGQD